MCCIIRSLTYMLQSNNQKPPINAAPNEQKVVFRHTLPSHKSSINLDPKFRPKRAEFLP